MIRCRVLGHRWVFSEWVGGDRVWRFCSRCYFGGLKSVDRIEYARRSSLLWLLKRPSRVRCRLLGHKFVGSREMPDRYHYVGRICRRCLCSEPPPPPP